MIKYTGDSDPRVVVIDEVVGMWLALVCVPKRFACYAVAFIAFRILDIAKPFPINWAERLPGGIGVMADDLVAGAIALVFIQLVCLPYLI